MNLREHSRQQYLFLTAYIGTDETRFHELLQLLYAGPRRLTQMAAGLLGHCAEAQPALLVPHVAALSDFCRQPNLPDAVRRNFMRALQFTDVPAEAQGAAFDLCLDLLNDAQEPVATKAFALTAATRLCQQYPPLARELLLVLEPQLALSRPALRSRARTALPVLRRLRDAAEDHV
jgi:hypothetical protein